MSAYKKIFIIGRSRKGGFGLIEVMLSFALLSTLIAGILLLQGRLMHSKVVIERVDVAKNIAVQRLEDVIIQYSYATITTANVNRPPLFTMIIKHDGIPYRPECIITPFDSAFDNASNGGRDGDGSPPDDYKKIEIIVTYPIRGVSFKEGVGTQTVVRYLYNNPETVYTP